MVPYQFEYFEGKRLIWNLLFRNNFIELSIIGGC